MILSDSTRKLLFVAVLILCAVLLGEVFVIVGNSNGSHEISKTKLGLILLPLLAASTLCSALAYDRLPAAKKKGRILYALNGLFLLGSLSIVLGVMLIYLVFIFR